MKYLKIYFLAITIFLLVLLIDLTKKQPITIDFSDLPDCSGESCISIHYEFTATSSIVVIGEEYDLFRYTQEVIEDYSSYEI